VITGPTIVNGGVTCLGDVTFQAPAETWDQEPAAIVFTDFDIEEIGYIEP